MRWLRKLACSVSGQKVNQWLLSAPGVDEGTVCWALGLGHWRTAHFQRYLGQGLGETKARTVKCVQLRSWGADRWANVPKTPGWLTFHISHLSCQLYFFVSLPNPQSIRIINFFSNNYKYLRTSSVLGIKLIFTARSEGGAVLPLCKLGGQTGEAERWAQVSPGKGQVGIPLPTVSRAPAVTTTPHCLLPRGVRESVSRLVLKPHVSLSTSISG